MLKVSERIVTFQTLDSDQYPVPRREYIHMHALIAKVMLDPVIDDYIRRKGKQNGRRYW